MKYCKKCLTTNLRPNSVFNNDGICIVCEYSNLTDNRIFNNDLKVLKSMVKKTLQKKRKHSLYDCIIGVSGGKDSTRQAHWVRDRLKLNPLLVCCAYPPLQTTNIGAENLSNLISMGFDVEVFSPAPRTSALLSLASFKKFGNVCKSTEMALFASVPSIAISKKIPLIFWGENPALQVGDSRSAGYNYFDGNNLRFLNTLVDGGSNWLHDEVGNYKSKSYIYPKASSLKKAKINIIYLGPAWDDWGMDNNAIYASLSGLTLRPNDSLVTGDITGASMLDEEFTNINMMIKYYKYGFGRATDICNERIRNNSITRDEAIKIVDKYDGICSETIIDKYCEYVNIKKTYFWDIVNRFTNSHIFEVNKGSRPIRKFEVGLDYSD